MVEVRFGTTRDMLSCAAFPISSALKRIMTNGRTGNHLPRTRQRSLRANLSSDFPSMTGDIEVLETSQRELDQLIDRSRQLCQTWPLNEVQFSIGTGWAQTYEC